MVNVSRIEVVSSRKRWLLSLSLDLKMSAQAERINSRAKSGSWEKSSLANCGGKDGDVGGDALDMVNGCRWVGGWGAWVGWRAEFGNLIGGVVRGEGFIEYNNSTTRKFN